MFYTVPDSKEEIAQLMFLYENAGGAEAENWIDYDYKYLRLMVEVKKLDTKISLAENKKIVARAQELFPNAKVSVVGTLAQSMEMVDYLVKGQIVSFFISMLVIVILLMIVFGSVKLGLVSLIPNITPAFVVGGIMGYFKIPLDMMTITIVPMLIGLAVDDTIHFINHGKLTFDKTGNYRKTIKETFRTVGVALVFTSIILSVNFLIYTTSKVNMLVHMGGLASAGIVVALLTDLFVTPILVEKFKIFGKETGKNDLATKELPIQEQDKILEYEPVN
ncbi:MAG: MMPL family transporter [Chloroflexia bacterium]|nr:MMPL family transporter [Chloroflexia bacterium]